MQQRVFASGAKRILASAFLAVLWFVIGVLSFLFGIVSVNVVSCFFLILSIPSVILMITYIRRTIVQLRLSIAVDPQGIIIKKGNGAGRTYPFTQYQITADSSNDSTMYFLFGIISLFAGTKKQLMIIDQTAPDKYKTVVTHLSKKSFKELVDVIEKESSRVEEELQQQESEHDFSEDIAVSKEYALNKRRLKNQYIPVASVFLTLPVIVNIMSFSNQGWSQPEMVFYMLLFDSIMLLLGLLLCLPIWFTNRKIPSKVILKSNCFYMDDKQFFISEISKMQLTSAIKQSDTGYRMFNFVYEGRKHKYFLGMNSDTRTNKSILVLNEYREIVSYFKKQYKNRPNVLVQDF